MLALGTVIRRSVLPILLVAASCGGGSSKSWPDRPLVETTAEIGPHTVRLLLPKGVGKYEDPRGTIWRDVSPDYAFFIKVFAGPHPASLDRAVEDLALDPDQRLLHKRVREDGFEVVVEEPGNKRHTFYLWQKRGAASVSCAGILGRKIGDPTMVKKSNEWIARICRSVVIQ